MPDNPSPVSFRSMLVAVAVGQKIPVGSNKEAIIAGEFELDGEKLVLAHWPEDKELFVVKGCTLS